VSAPARLYTRSAIAAASCLKRFHEVHDLGLEDASDESRRGTAFHRIILEEYVPALLAAGTSRDLALLDRAFRAGVRATRCPAHLLDEVEDLVFTWGQAFELDLGAFLLAEERQVHGRVSWQPDLVFAYRVTPRGSLLLIRDLKTYHAILTEERIRTELQAQVYARDAMQIWPGFDRYRFEMDFVRYGAVVGVEFTEEEFASLDRKVDAAIATIEDADRRGDWPAQPGEHCGYCRLLCDVADDPRCLDRRAQNREEAAIVAGRVLVLQRMLTSDLAMLRAFTTTEGPVVVGQMEWAHRKIARQKFPAPEVLAIVQAERDQGDRPFPIPAGLTFSKSALAPILQRKGVRRRHPAMVEAIEALARETTSTKFTAKKVGDVAPDTADAPED
jgi:hypothetical protein